jgi:hypothetical protein
VIELLITVLIIVLVFGLVYWIITLIPLPQPFATIAQVVLAIILLLVLLRLLLPLSGLHAFPALKDCPMTMTTLPDALRWLEQLDARLTAVEAEVALRRGSLALPADSDPVTLHDAEPNAPR